jgi:hypothetical protein
MKKAFEARLLARGEGGAWTIVRVPFDVKEVFGTGGRVPVKGRINGFAFRSQLFAMGKGQHCLMINKEMQKAAAAQAGDTARFEVEADTAPRPVVVPPELKKALSRSAPAKKVFDGLSPSHRRAYTDWIAQAKKEETRTRRVAQALRMLAAGKKRM